MSDRIFASNFRKKIIVAIVFIVGVGFSGQLIKMQIIDNKTFKEKSDNNSIKKIVYKAPRGIFFDRNYHILVSNKPSYSLQITPALYDTADGKVIEDILDLEKGTVKNILHKKRGYSKYLPRVIKRDVSYNDIALIEEHSEFLKGVNVVVDMQRDYSFDVKASHIFGYLREINSQQLKKHKDVYSLGDYIGIKGVERAYEEYLRGVKGYGYILVDSRRKTIGKYLEGKNDVLPEKGHDIVFTIDAKIQKIAEKEFEKFSGSLVAIEPESGEILAYVSAPDYDLGEFASVTSQKSMRKLGTDPKKPLFDRAANSIYPPGSTIKILAALVGLEEGIITPYTEVMCKGGYQYGDRFFRCHGVDGSVNVVEAIEHSCNTFFYKLILDIGLEKWAKYLRMFGFGSPTGIDISKDSRGIVVDADYYDKKFGKRRWGKGNLISLGIGQGELSVTTLQLAQYTALLANYGKTKVPHIGKGFIEEIQSDLIPFNFAEKSVNISRKSFDVVRKGMFNVVNRDGTAAHIRLPNIKIAGKTGTAQNPHGKDHSIFIGFAPYDNPKIAVACIVENVGFGGAYAAPIVQKVIKSYLSNLEADSFDVVGVK